LPSLNDPRSKRQDDFWQTSQKTSGGADNAFTAAIIYPGGIPLAYSTR